MPCERGVKMGTIRFEIPLDERWTEQSDHRNRLAIAGQFGSKAHIALIGTVAVHR